MIRRDLLKFLGAAPFALVAADLILPKRSIFLPPAMGWVEAPLVMREVQQYLISNDSLPWRYDAAWVDEKTGVKAQYHILMEPIEGEEWLQSREGPTIQRYREIARHMFENVRAHYGYSNNRQVRLPLPISSTLAAYV